MLHSAAIGVVLLIVTLIRIKHSWQEPGGLLHGARVSLRPFTHARGGSDAAYQDLLSRQNDTCNLHAPWEEPLPAIRTEFGDLATTVYGWPSTGGVWVRHRCYGVELDFLGLDRFNASATQRYSEDEDAFCKRLALIGGRLFESDEAYNQRRPYHDSPHVWIGWPEATPEGKVWALWVWGNEGAGIGVSRIYNAHTIEERCEAIEMLGGKLYAKFEDVAHDEPKGPSDEVVEEE